MSDQEKADLVAGGVILNEDKQYKLIVPLLSDEDSFLYEHRRCDHDASRKLVQFNFGYEQFRFIVD